MTEDLSIQGSLDETTVPDLFRSLIRSGESGLVTLEGTGRHDNVYFRDGQIVYATSSDPDLGLADVLLRGGELTLDQYTRTTEGLFGQKRVGSLLCELGFLHPDELTHAVERQVNEIVTRTLDLRGGNYSVEFSGEFGIELPALHVNTLRLILDGINRIEHWSLISRGIGRLERILKPAANADARIYHLDFSEEESHVYSLVSDGQSVRAVCERSYLSNFVTCRMLWALLTTNLVEDAGGEPADTRRTALESEMELEAAVERYNDAFQRIFTLVFQRIGDHTFDFMDRVVLHLSPEVQPYLGGINLLNEGRVDFDQLHNNIVASGSADRQNLIFEVLNELLYGWIYETKKEFRGEMESDLDTIIRGLKS